MKGLEKVIEARNILSDQMRRIKETIIMAEDGILTLGETAIMVARMTDPYFLAIAKSVDVVEEENARLNDLIESTEVPSLKEVREATKGISDE